MSIDTVKQVTTLLEEGLTLTEVEKFVHQTPKYIRGIANDIGWDMSWRKRSPKDRARNEDIYDLKINEKWTLQKIGDKYGVSRERIRQILASMNYRMRQEEHARYEDPITITAVSKLIITGKFTPSQVSKKIGFPLIVVENIIKNLPMELVDTHHAKFVEIEYMKAKKTYENKMAIPLRMWDANVETEIIAQQMTKSKKYKGEINRASLNQLINKCRKKFGWFPTKYGAQSKILPESVIINKLIIADKRNRQIHTLQAIIREANKQIEASDDLIDCYEEIIIQTSKINSEKSKVLLAQYKAFLEEEQGKHAGLESDLASELEKAESDIDTIHGNIADEAIAKEKADQAYVEKNNNSEEDSKKRKNVARRTIKKRKQELG